MKKLLCIFAAVALAGCSNGGVETIILTDISINEITKDLEVGDEYQMSVTTNPTSNVKAEWSSSNTSVATISSSGVLKVASDGVTTITATVGSLKDEISIAINRVQDYTSFSVYNPDESDYQWIAGYFNIDGDCIKIADIGIIDKEEMSESIIVDYDAVKEVFLFFPYNETKGCKLKKTYMLKKNRHNVVVLEGSSDIVDKNDPKQYPQ